MNIPLCRPNIGPEETKAVLEVLDSSWLASGGHYNEKFEKAFAEFIQVPHAIATNSCTSALETALSVSGLQGEVIVPSLTWVATANAVVNANLKPTFSDVDEETRNVTAALLEEKISSYTKAIIVVHYSGQPCQMDDIIQLCQKYHLLLIEDSAQTLGATWHGRQAGSFGIGCFSFYPTKNITSGLGGMLSCRDDNLARQARAFITHGIFYDSGSFISPWARSAEIAGHNYQMSNLLAALGYHQLLRLKELNEQREALAKRYSHFLASWKPLVKLPSTAQGATHVYQMYTIQIKESLRDRVLKELWAQNIWAGIHFDPPVHLQPFYLRNGTKSGSLPVTERLAKQLITLPIYPDMTEAEQDYVIHNLEKALNKKEK